MYETLIDKLDNEVQRITIKKTNKKLVKKDLNSAADSLIDQKVDTESVADLPTPKPRTEKILDLRKIKKVKKEVVIDKPPRSKIKPKKKHEVVWL